tara:strand:- start:424 stop:864 length:441 start_codon:yes stop_codon:yes gene_type:complete
MSQQLELIISKLEKVSGSHGRYKARCPAHNDRGPSLSVAEGDDGRILIHCFAGCDVHQVVSAVGLQLTDLFPTDDYVDRVKYDRKPRRNYRAIVENARYPARLLAVYANVIYARWDELAKVLDLDDHDKHIFKGCADDVMEILKDE